MQVPFDEVANYAPFHEAAGAAFTLARKLFDENGLAILAHGDGVLRVVKAAGFSTGTLTEGSAIAADSDIADLLSKATASGTYLSEPPATLGGIDSGTVAIAPIILNDGRPFGAILALPPAESSWGSTELEMLEHLAKLISFAVESELKRRLDRLTGLYNRSMFDDHLGLEIARSRRNGSWLAVLVTGFEFPKPPPVRNEAWWLAQVAERLQTSIRRGDTVARVGPREFGLLVPDLREGEASRRMATTLVEMLMDPITGGEDSLVMTPSVGITLVPANGFNPRHLFDKAVNTMEYVRSRGGGTFALYSDIR